MSDFKFNCTYCSQHLAATEEMVGRQIECPSCQRSLVIPPPENGPGQPRNVPSPAGLRMTGAAPGPAATPPLVAPQPTSKPGGSYCRQCGKPLAAGTAFCASCGAPVAGGPAPSERSSGLPPNIAGGLCYAGGVFIPMITMTTQFLSLSGMEHVQRVAPVTQWGFMTGSRLLLMTGPWIVGLIFLIVDKRPFVRFHALQSIVWFIGLSVLGMVVGIISSFVLFPYMTKPGGMPNLTLIRVWSSIMSLAALLIFIANLVAMVAAFIGRKYHLPLAGETAESWLGKD